MTWDAPSLLGTAHAASRDDTARDLGPLVESALRLVEASDRAPAASAALDGPREPQVGTFTGLLQVGVVLAGRGLQLEHVNGRARELCGCADGAAFRKAWEVLGPVLRRSLDDASSGRPEGRPLLVEVRPGRTVRAEVQRLEGSAEEYLVVLSDPRALEALEDDVRLRRQLKGLGRVYRTLAHELRAPLGAVMLHLDLLQESLGGSDHRNEGARRLVGMLRGELDRLNRSLHGILTEDVPQASPERFDLAGSLRDLVALLAPQAGRQSVELEVRLQADALPVRGYPDRLRQAFLNVAVNALEAMPRGGRLRLEAWREGTWARVALRDSGPGIPAAALPRVYEPEFTTKDGGTGFGLHVARAAVELHGGEIGIFSRPGHGTAVLVAVPLAIPPLGV